MEDYDRHVADLAVAHRAKRALRALMAAGSLATPALRRGLRDADPLVRAGCCIVLDHFLDEETLPELMENLAHPDERVRGWALHALACDRCKEGACRPGEDEVVPLTVRMLRDDPSRRVRAQAVHLLGAVAQRRPDALVALERARVHDADPNVRKIASRYTPGGAIFERGAARAYALPSAGARRPYPRRRKRNAAVAST
jgi:HEAT repeat protein